MARWVALCRVVRSCSSTGSREEPGEIYVELCQHPLFLLTSHVGDAIRVTGAMADDPHRAGDTVFGDSDGLITGVGRTDDVFKASDCTTSSFELVSALIGRAAVIPSLSLAHFAEPEAHVFLLLASNRRRRQPVPLLPLCGTV